MSSKVIRTEFDGADCECCGTYSSWIVYLDCGHEFCEYDEYKIGDVVNCRECREELLKDIKTIYIPIIISIILISLYYYFK